MFDYGSIEPVFKKVHDLVPFLFKITKTKTLTTTPFEALR